MDLLTGGAARKQEQALQQQGEQFEANQRRSLAQMAFEAGQLDQAAARGGRRRRGRGLLTFANTAQLPLG